MNVRCRNCGNEFEVENEDFQCPMCGYNTRPTATNKIRISEVNWKDIIFWICFVVLTFLVFYGMGFFELAISFPIYGLIILLTSSIKKMFKIKFGNYKEIMGQRLDRNTVTSSDVDGGGDYHKVVYSFYVDGKEYRCAGGDFKSFSYNLFTSPKKVIVYNVEDPRISFEKVSSWKTFFSVLCIIIFLLGLLM